jgi:hypothetical protein
VTWPLMSQRGTSCLLSAFLLFLSHVSHFHFLAMYVQSTLLYAVRQSEADEMLRSVAMPCLFVSKVTDVT